jgi:hypothetical protein
VKWSEVFWLTTLSIVRSEQRRWYMNEMRVVEWQWQGKTYVPAEEDLIKWINILAPEFFFVILAHSVYKMWIIQEANKLELWNKLYFEEKKLRVYTMFKISGTYICWINI